MSVKATVSFRWDWSGLPCLVQLLTWLHVSDCCNFWNTEDDRLWINILVSNNCFRYRNVSKMASTLCQKLFTIFCQKRLQTSDVSISNGNIKCPMRKSIFAVNLPLRLFVLPLLMLILKVLSLSIHRELCHRGKCHSGNCHSGRGGWAGLSSTVAI